MTLMVFEYSLSAACCHTVALDDAGCMFCASWPHSAAVLAWACSVLLCCTSLCCSAVPLLCVLMLMKAVTVGFLDCCFCFLCELTADSGCELSNSITCIAIDSAQRSMHAAFVNSWAETLSQKLQMHLTAGTKGAHCTIESLH